MSNKKSKNQTVLTNKNHDNKLGSDSSPKVKINDDNQVLLQPDEFAKISNALGTTDSGIMSLFLDQVVRSSTLRKISREQHTNNALAILYGIKPQNELEGMLVVQMIGVHNLANEFLARTIMPEQSPDMIDSNVNRASKLLRTFTMQIEALNRLRGTNQQKMTVEHVHVHEGGRAIVGNVVSGEGGKHENGG